MQRWVFSSPSEKEHANVLIPFKDRISWGMSEAGEKEMSSIYKVGTRFSLGFSMALSSAWRHIDVSLAFITADPRPARASHSMIFVRSKKRDIIERAGSRPSKNLCIRLASIIPDLQLQTESWASKVLIMLFYHLSRLWWVVEGKNSKIILILTNRMWLHLK